MATNCNSPQYRVVHSKFYPLVKSIASALGSFTSKAFEKNLISQEQSRDANESGRPKHETSQTLMHQILNKIEYKSDSYDLFVSILEDIPILRDVATELRSAVGSELLFSAGNNQLQLPAAGHQTDDARKKLHLSEAAAVQANSISVTENQTSSLQNSFSANGQVIKENHLTIDHETIQMPCLGRPFKVGMFYDGQNDILIQNDATWWDPDKTLQSVRITEYALPSRDTYEAILVDTLHEKTSQLGIKGGLVITAMSNGLVTSTSGSAAYLHDRIESNQQIRACLKFQSFSIVRKLELGVIPQENVHGMHTHIVTEVCYGVEAFLVLDNYETEQHHKLVQQKMYEAAKALAKNPDMSLETIAPDKTEVWKCCYTLYADSRLPKKMASFTEAVDTFRKLSRLLKPVPKTVQLYPLCKLTNKTVAKVMTDISDPTTTMIQNLLEGLHQVKIVCNDIKQSPLWTKFSFITVHINEIEILIKELHSLIMKYVTTMFPLIRSGKVAERNLIEFVNYSLSFSLPKLKSFATHKQKELSQMQLFIGQITEVEFFSNGIELDSELNGHCYDVVCFAFNVIHQQDPHISLMQLNPIGGETGDHEIQAIILPWYKDAEVLQRIQQQISTFIKFAETNKNCPNVKFIVTDNAEEHEGPGTILISNNGRLEKFVPPSEPGQPIAQESDITHNCIQLKWIPPESGSENVSLYTVFYRSLSDLTQQWSTCTTSSSQTTVKISDLLHSTSYVFMVQATTKYKLFSLNSKESEPIKTTKPTCQPGKPKLVTVTHSSISLQWAKPEFGSDKVACYTIQCTEEGPTEISKFEYNTGKPQLNYEVTGLCPHTRYIFRVLPKSTEDGYVSKLSEASDPIITYAPVCQPGKPYAIDVSDNSVKLFWDKPKHNSDEVELYIVSYSLKSDQSVKVKEKVTAGSETSVIINHLEPSKVYLFKVWPLCMTKTSGVDSEYSDPVKVNPRGDMSINLKALNVTHNSITLQWKRAMCEEHKVESYKLFYCKSSDFTACDWMTESIKGCLREITVTGLTPNTEYYFKFVPVFPYYGDGVEAYFKPIKTNPLVCQPGKPKTFAELHNSISLEWDKPQHGVENIQTYIVYYRCANNNSTTIIWPWKTKCTDDATEQMTITDGLEANKSYIFKVKPDCITNNNTLMVLESEESDPIQARFQECKPGKPKPTCTTYKSITLKWDIPEHIHVKSYALFYCTVHNYLKDNWSTKFISSSENETTVNELQPNEAYVFKILPESSVANCVESELSDLIRTKALVCQPGKPIAIILPNSNDTIGLKWDEPKHGQEDVQSYIVSYQSTNDSSEAKKLIDAPERQVDISGLSQNKKYIFKVHPVCKSSKYEMVTSNESDPIMINSKPSKPTPIEITWFSVKLEWEMDQEASHNVEAYAVHYRSESDPRNEWKKQSTRNSTTTHTVHSLDPGTSYLFKVISTSKAGTVLEGDVSESICTAYTSKPRKLSALKVTDREIHLSWAGPKVGTKHVNFYTILYLPARFIDDSTGLIEWKEYTTEDSNTEIRISSLKSGTKYRFKVRPECGVIRKECESDLSDIVETKITSKPRRLMPKNVANTSVLLNWEKPERGNASVTCYSVSYQELNDPLHKWEVRKTTNNEERLLIIGLYPSTEYQFKVHPECETGNGTESDISDPIKTKPICKTGIPRATNVTHNSIKYIWTKPADCGSLTSYKCTYWSVTEQKAKSIALNSTEESIVISSLTPNSTYVFKVCPVCEDMSQEISSCSITTNNIPVAEYVKEKCAKTDNDGCKGATVYQIPTETMEGLHRIVKYETDIDHPCMHQTTEKIIILVGATGTGKSTLINAIVNYIYKVKFDDNFRFRIICNESDNGQTHAQTSSVNVYTIPPIPDSHLDYTLTVIDTPGFGNTHGLEHDFEIITQIKDLFTHTTPNHKGIGQIHGIGFVVKNPEARLTATQRYIFSSMLGLFGQDIKENIFLMVTFSDGATPPVLEAVKEAAFPYQEYFKFNNSALYPEAESNDPVALPMWNMGQESFKQFFLALQKYKPKSLTLTREVLEERERLESYVKTLREEITRGVQDIDKLEQLKEKLKTKEQNMDAFKDFKLTVTVTKQRRVGLPRGVYVMNCLTCNRTCHNNCTCTGGSDGHEHQCCVMKPNNPTDARCTVCEGKCSWRQHVNNSYKFEFYTEEVEQTIEEMKKHHDEAKSRKLDVEATIEDLEKGLDELHEHIMSLVTNAQKSLARLGEIALKPNPPTNEHYIDLLIEEERREARTGFEKRIATLEQLKKRDKVICKTVMSGTATQDPATTFGRQRQKRWYHFLFQ